MLLTFNAVNVLEIVLNLLFLLLLSPNNGVGAVLSHFTDEEIKKILQDSCRLGRYSVWWVRIQKHITLIFGSSF